MSAISPITRVISTARRMALRDQEKARTISSTSQGQRTRVQHLAKGRKVACKAIGIYYATTTGNTEAAAEWVKDLMVSV